MKTIRDEQVGKSSVRIVQTAEGFAGVLIQDDKVVCRLEDEDADQLWKRLLVEVGKASPQYFGFDGAIARFRRIFPQGFASADYAQHERSYKCAARDWLLQHLPLERARAATEADCVPAMQAFAKTNLLSQFEAARVRDVLKGPGGPAFLRAAAALADGDVAPALRAMERLMREHGSPSWPMATYLPYFWLPEEAMFLKPDVTRDFAENVGHSFGRDYQAGFVASVYESLLDLTEDTERQLADLRPRDRIDVQSFIWVVGAYDEPDSAGQVAPGD